MTDQPKKKKSEQESAQDFANKYKELCDESGYRIVTTPAFQARDDGTWSLVLQASVGKLPQGNAE